MNSPKQQKEFGIFRWLVDQQFIVVSLILVLAGVLRLFHLFEIRSNDPFFEHLSVDPSVYHQWAKLIADGNWLGDQVFFLSPLYPYFLAALYKVLGPGFFIGRLVQALGGVLSTWLIFSIGKRVWSPPVGIVAALLFALYLPAIFYDGVLLVAGIQTPLCLLTVWTLLRCADKHSYLRWGLAGLVLGLCALARPNVLLFAGFAIIWIFTLQLPKPKLKYSIIAASVFCLGVGIAVFPVTVRNYLVGDDVVLVSSQAGVNFYIGNGPDADGNFRVPKLFAATNADDPIQQRQAYRKYAEYKTGRKLKPSQVSSFWFNKTFEEIKRDPSTWAGLMIKKACLTINQYEAGNSRDIYSSRQFSKITRLPLLTLGIIMPFALLGLLITLSKPKALLKGAGSFLIVAMFFTHVLTMIIFFVLAHYRMPVTPFIALLAALGIVWLFEKISNKKPIPLSIGTLLLAGSFVLVNLNLNDYETTRFMVHYNLGNKYRAMKRDDLAIEQYTQSIKLNSDYISAKNNLALVYEADKKTWPKAIKTWQEIEQLAIERRDRMYLERSRRHIQKLKELSGHR